MFHSGERGRNVHMPGRSDVDEIDVVSFDQILEIVVAVCVDCRRVLAGAFHGGLRGQRFFLDRIADGCHAEIVGRDPLREHGDATTLADADHP